MFFPDFPAIDAAIKLHRFLKNKKIISFIIIFILIIFQQDLRTTVTQVTILRGEFNFWLI
jgi:hypothetical protein